MICPWELSNICVGTKLISVGTIYSHGSRMPRRTPVQMFIEYIQQGKHNIALTMLPAVKRKLTLVKTLVVEYSMEDGEKFLQVTVPSEGQYIIWVVARRENKTVHRFYIKQSSRKTKGDKVYNIITWRIPSELRGSRLHVRICRVE